MVMLHFNEIMFPGLKINTSCKPYRNPKVNGTLPCVIRFFSAIHFESIESPVETKKTRVDCTRNNRCFKVCHSSSTGFVSDTDDTRARTTFVKMCGVTTAEDAAMVAEAGADFVGMIIWPNSKRSVPLSTAKEISRVVKSLGVKPVGVFVDDDAETIARASNFAGLEFVQLHGDGSRSALPDLKQHFKIIYVLNADETGKLKNTISEEDCAAVDWILVDSATGGSGKVFDWKKMSLPPIKSKCGWLLAGGINPSNAEEAIAVLKPNGIDVSSGICSEDGIAKDKNRVLAFMSAFRSTKIL